VQFNEARTLCLHNIQLEMDFGFEKGLVEKRMGATNVGVRRAHSYSWSLSSPQQPPETEDSPTVSLAPQYTSQDACPARHSFEGISEQIKSAGIVKSV
jgi:hypothetical protein